MRKSLPILLALAVLAGCRSYMWTSSVPEEMRTVSVPTFRNETDVVELGAVATRQVLREFQREGTFRIAGGDAALEVQGVLKSSHAGILNFKREVTARAFEYRFSVEADVSLVDRRTGQVLVDNRRYRAETTFYADIDVVTGRRDASGRLMEDLAQQIVDDVVGYPWKGRGASEKKEGNQ